MQNSRTARARTSGENLFVVLLVMGPPSQESEPPINPDRFKDEEDPASIVATYDAGIAAAVSLV
jgi:hypothetical protein